MKAYNFLIPTGILYNYEFSEGENKQKTTKI